MQDRIDDDEEREAHQAEVRRCRNDTILLPDHDPRRTAAHERLNELTGSNYQIWRKAKLMPRKLWRRIRSALLLAFILPLQIMLIVVCNVVGFLLLWWLLLGF